MKQSVLKGKDIFATISKYLNNAKKEIIVVSAWFTDQDLLDILISKLSEGVDVSIIVADNKDNFKLNFDLFEKSGGFLRKVKGKGFGIMHQKYCVIDKTEAFHGSYNWTVNARKNNSESVILTNHKNTIQELLIDYNKLAMKEDNDSKSTDEVKSKGWVREVWAKVKPKENDIEKDKTTEELNKIENVSVTHSLDEVFKSIISAEIKKTNRSEIKEMAYNQAKEVSGDCQVITKSMDSLYHLFVSDKKENDENKKRLLQKIEDKVSEFNQNIDTTKDAKLNSVQVEITAEEKRIHFQKAEAEGRKSNKKTEKNNIIETTIPNKEKLISDLKEEISEFDIKFVKPLFKYHEFIPRILFFLGLAIVMVLFYSSSAYIMLYSFDDALLAAERGVSVNPQVYESKAVSKAIAKGGTAIYYILLFVFIPFAIAYSAHDNNSVNVNKITKHIKKYISYAVVIAIDTFIALKVSSTIGEINYLTKGVVYERSFDDINFWLVFFLGAIPFFFLADLMNKLISFFANRNTQEGIEKMLAEKKILKNRIDNLNSEVDIHKEHSNKIDLEMNNLDNEISQLKQSEFFLPKELNTKTSQINQAASNGIANIRKKADVYKNDIENDNIQISLSSLKDRVSAFIEGWNEWLHDEYSIEKAVGKSQEAIKESDQWLAENMKKIEA
jgi:hypothetical protein